MWIRVALDKDSMHLAEPVSNSYVYGPHMREFYFGQAAARKLEKDGFLRDMWRELDALVDWGDCDFFLPDKCRQLSSWLLTKLAKPVSDDDLWRIYTVMLEYTAEAIAHDTGLSFEF